MKISKGLQNTQQSKVQPITRIVLATDEWKHLSDFFALLIQIDQKSKRKGMKNGE